MISLTDALKRFLRDEQGVTAIEYALLASLIAVIIVGAVKVVGTTLCESFYNKVVVGLGGLSQAC